MLQFVPRWALQLGHSRAGVFFWVCAQARTSLVGQDGTDRGKLAMQQPSDVAVLIPMLSVAAVFLPCSAPPR